jgi:hypothetical protein
MLDYNVVAEGLLRYTTWVSRMGFWDCDMAFILGPVFEESYAIRASIIAGKVLGLGKAELAAQAFCDRVLLFQDVAERNMYFMGYAHNRDAKGMPCCSCVADTGSSAMTIVEALRAYPKCSKNETYIASLRRYADHVLENYATPDGVIGVGIIGHEINPLKEYWCANALFSPVLIGLGELTGEKKYLEAAVGPLNFLARFDYKTAADYPSPQWLRSCTELILYASEGILEGLLSESMREYLDKPARDFRIAASSNESDVKLKAAPNREKAAVAESSRRVAKLDTLRGMLENRWNEFAVWLHQNQNIYGYWEDTLGYRCYQLGLSWTMLRACGIKTDVDLEPCIKRQLSYMITPDAQRTFRVLCEPFGSSLASLSYAYAGQICAKQAPAEFETALDRAKSAGKWTDMHGLG